MADHNIESFYVRLITWLLIAGGVPGVSALQKPVPKPPDSKTQQPGSMVVDATKKRASHSRPTPIAISTDTIHPTAAPPEEAKAVAKPSKVTLMGGLLTITADNSDLGEILQQVSGLSGMVVDGYASKLRVYGTYGPRDPRNVLSDLLRGTGYNFIMVGVTEQGVPKSLSLTPQTGGASPPMGEPSPVTTARENREPAGREERPGAGAIVEVPPARLPSAEERREQRINRLQQMREKQEQAQPKP